MIVQKEWRNKEGARKLRRAVEEELKIEEVEVVQKQPWTMVRVLAIWHGRAYEDHGFSKVCYPDEWDAEEGVRVAKRKAIADIARQVVDYTLESFEEAMGQIEAALEIARTQFAHQKRDAIALTAHYEGPHYGDKEDV